MRAMAHSAASPDQTPCAAADAAFAEAQGLPLFGRSPADERERPRTRAAPAGSGVDAQAPARTPRSTPPGEGCRSGRGGRRYRALAAAPARTPPGDNRRHGAGCAPRWVALVNGAQTVRSSTSRASPCTASTPRCGNRHRRHHVAVVHAPDPHDMWMHGVLPLLPPARITPANAGRDSLLFLLVKRSIPHVAVISCRVRFLPHCHLSIDGAPRRQSSPIAEGG